MMPSKIGRYEIKGQLGQGGMAVVYRAIDPNIGREVAVKVLPRELLQNPGFRTRFQREVKAIGRLENPAIVPVYDADEYQSQPYLVMKLMSGGSLLDKMRQGTLPLTEVVQMFSRLAPALEEAHAKGIIHRDLKPANIMLDQQGLAYLSDFGIAKVMEADSLTTHGTAGTPAYMSPEHFEGKICPQSDIYAMGIILFQLLTGEFPFRANTAPAWMKAHFMDTPLVACSINPNLPTAIEPIISRALAKQPAERYSTMGEMARALQEIVSIAPPISQIDTSPALVKKKVDTPAKTSLPSPALVKEKVDPPAKTSLAKVAVPLTKSEERTVVVHAPSPPVPPKIRTKSKNHKILWGVVPIAIAAIVFGWLFFGKGEKKKDVNATATTAVQAEPLTQVPDGMVLIPAGSFSMGSDPNVGLAECKKLFYKPDDCKREWFEVEAPIHTVTLDAFYMDKYEVTNAQYAECVKAGQCKPPTDTKSATRQSYYGNAEYDTYPIIYVDWTQAKTYCEWRGGRLPTEAQWEKAARGTDGRIYPWGNDFDGRKGNFCDKNCFLDWANKNYDDGYADTAPVGSYPSGVSPNGVYDMAGNVWEWGSDYDDVGYYNKSPQNNPENNSPSNARVLRGGSWNGIDFDSRSVARDRSAPTNSVSSLGFRCVRS